jgi:hypothetical protein
LGKEFNDRKVPEGVLFGDSQWSRDETGRIKTENQGKERGREWEKEEESGGEREGERMTEPAP